MKYFVSNVCISLAVFWSIPSLARAPHFDISPKVCVVMEQHDFCDLELQLSWQLAMPQDVCLYENNQQLGCWQQSSQGQHQYKARVQVETIYSLINPLTGKQVATAKVAVQSTDAKTTRRRLRSPWSFF
ncbi:DUF3019 domain-containing protein [Pseudoalteromonas mariniglutinosa]|uniref:DUF3019 domain-containing protein n=1 Tax=Pseudoalteromonas mariniglutinosa TaxID=206042 RepID=UPI00384AC775